MHYNRSGDETDAESQLNTCDPQNQRNWQNIFDRFDADGTGRLTKTQLMDLIEASPTLSSTVTKRLNEHIDRTRCSPPSITFNDFFTIIQNRSIIRQDRKLFDRYVKKIVPVCRPSRTRHRSDSVDGVYEDEYTCWPPAVVMLVVSFVEILFYIATLPSPEFHDKNSLASKLVFDPKAKMEVWRFLTYACLHVNLTHLLTNILIQILLGTPLEMVHRWWRVLLIYVVGIMTGSLLTSVFDPHILLIGASGGSYALMFAHAATIILNWKEMENASVQMACFLLIVFVDIATAIRNRYTQRVAYWAHFGGAVAGLLVGLNVLRNLQVTKLESAIKYFSFVVYVVFVVAAISWNILKEDPLFT